ncbi:MAG: peptide ABC transporter substrate-binding protein [Anaerolineae bacterium]
MQRAFKEKGASQKPLFLRLFRRPSLICFSLAFHSSYGFCHEQLFKIFHSLFPGTQERLRSSYVWASSDLPYIFCYIEVHKLRGEEFSSNKLKEIGNGLRNQLLTIPPLTPALFWPYNEEESYRQIQLLQREVNSSEDLPHISIHFQEQTLYTLEFLIHLVRPKTSELLDRALKRLPESVHYFCHFHHVRKIKFSIEVAAFSVKVSSLAFDVGNSINLLYARRYVLKYLEAVIGPFRDYNGGLFEKQQHHFEIIRVRLRDRIQHFDLFAEKVFYALHPVEMRFSLSLNEAENLFSAFSELLQSVENFSVISRFKNVLVIKTTNSSDLLRWRGLRGRSKESIPQAQLTLGEFHYLCLLGPKVSQIEPLLRKRSFLREKVKTLRLVFQEGAPLSLSPYHSSGDMRALLLSKLLFEGLMRLNVQGKPEFAGARELILSEDGLVYTFKLRPYCWSNGESITAIDYVTSWQSTLKDHVSHPEFLFVIKNARKFKENRCDAKSLGVRVLDAETLQVELEWIDPSFLSKLAQPFFFPLFCSMKEPKWFNGPYFIREQSKEGLVLERNPYFWDAKHSFFDQIDIKWVDDPKVISRLFLEGKVDWIGDPLSGLSSQLIEHLEKEGKLLKRAVNRRFLLWFNTKHSFLCSSLIRKALSLAIDRSLICRTVFPHSIAIPPLLPAKEEANVLFDRGLKELGLTRETFPSLTFSYSNHTRREKLAMILQLAWQEILGIKVYLEKIEWNFFRNKLEKRSFEIIGSIQDVICNDSFEFLQRFEGASSWNFSGWEHSQYRSLIEMAKQERDKKRGKEMLMHAEKILEEEVPFTPLFRYTHLFAHHPGLEGYQLDDEGCVDFSSAYFKTSFG